MSPECLYVSLGSLRLVLRIFLIAYSHSSLTFWPLGRMKGCFAAAVDNESTLLSFSSLCISGVSLKRVLIDALLRPMMVFEDNPLSSKVPLTVSSPSEPSRMMMSFALMADIKASRISPPVFLTTMVLRPGTLSGRSVVKAPPPVRL